MLLNNKNSFVHSLRLLFGVVGFLQPFSFLYRLGFFLYTFCISWGNLVSSPFVNNICYVFTDKKMIIIDKDIKYI